MKHFALFFSEQQLEIAKKQAEDTLFAEAWAKLETENPDFRLENTYWHALRYRLLDDEGAGRIASQDLPQHLSLSAETPVEQAQQAVTLMQIIDFLREHPQAKERTLPDIPADSDTYFETVWVTLAQAIHGILTNNTDSLDNAEQVYRVAVDNQIHPEGYLRPYADTESSDNYIHHLLTVSGLTLIAEALYQQGRDLYSYDNRGVTLFTAATYLIYYYYYPEKWRWDAELDLETTQQLTTEQGAFFEILNLRGSLRGIDELLEEQRPLFNLYGGGLTTLTHAKVKRKRRGFFL